MDRNAEDGITNQCRLCLNDNTEVESLYAPLEEICEDDVMSLYDVMQKLSPSKLSKDPKYPSYLCLNCISLLTTAYKVHRLIEISQYQLSRLFKEDFQVNKRNVNTELDTVEIIYSKGKYNLKDILIVEENSQEKLNFEGFLRNLGSEIRADFVSKNDVKKQTKEDEYHVVNIVPLSKSQGDIVNYVPEIEVVDNLSEASKSKLEIQDSVKCNYCDKIFTSKGSLYRHRELHLRKKSYLCQICGYVTNVRTTLTNHMLLKHRGKRFACEVCGKKYLSNSHLRYHMLIHKNERLYLCTVCGKSFNYASSLDYHMRIHTGEKKYKCTYCDRAFTMRCGLNRHLRTHTGLRPYKCSYCDKAFRSKGEVRCHEMTHTGFRPYHCKLCGKGFTKTHNLKIHMLGHPGPFLCEICQRSFTEPGYVKLHMKVVHGVQDFDIGSSGILVVQDERSELDDLNEISIMTPNELEFAGGNE